MFCAADCIFSCCFATIVVDLKFLPKCWRLRLCWLCRDFHFCSTDFFSLRLSGVPLISYTGIMQTHTQTHARAWSLAPEVVITSLQSCRSYTGYQCNSDWNLNLLSWGLQGTQQPGTVLSFRWLSTHYHHWAPLASIIRDNFKCTVIATSSHLGDWAFAVAGPRLWNSLPTRVCLLDLSLDTFYPIWKCILLFKAPVLSDCCF